MVRLPLEYQEVEYLESSRTQWIDTGVVIGDSEFEIYVDFTSVPIGSQIWISPFGTRTSSTKDRADFVFRGDSGGYYGESNSSVQAITKLFVGKNEILYDRHSILRNGINDASRAYTNAATLDYSMYLFATNNANSSANLFAGKISSAYIRKDGNLVFYGIPCYRKTDNEPGMYDTVSGTFYTNSGTGTFLVGNDVSWDTASLLERRRQILLNTPHIETVSGSIASFNTDISTNLKECKVYFSPVQEGTGDPSPDNVRPITGWDGVTVTSAGKNMAYLSDPRTNWNKPIGGSSVVLKRFVLKPNTYYTASTNCPRGTTTGNYDDVFIGTVTGISYTTDNNGVSLGRSRTVQTGSDGVVYLGVREGTGANFDFYGGSYYVQLEEGSVATEYTATTFTIPFNRTIYGGYVDLAKGEVVETWGSFVIDGINNYPTTAPQINDAGFAVAYDIIGQKGYANAPVGSKYNYGDTKVDSVPMRNSNWKQLNTNCIQCAYSADALYIRVAIDPNELNDVSSSNAIKESMKSWLEDNPIQVCYHLATPNTYTLTPETIKALSGINNIWSNANGNIEVSYYSH